MDMAAMQQVARVVRPTALASGVTRGASTMAEPTVLVDRGIGARFVTLNRPKALNALSLDMIREMYPLYQDWQSNDSVKMIVQSGAGGKSFCAGGDVAALYRAKKEGTDTTIMSDFFSEEYQVNHLIGNSTKPVISLMDGLVMGGGVGLSVHGEFRVATEKSLFAMPETMIGLFPDVGGSHFLPRLPGNLGMYLALTGTRLKASDLLYSQICTHFVPSERLPALCERLEQLVAPPKTLSESINTAIEQFAELPKDQPMLPQLRAQIDAAFGADSVEEVLAALTADGSEWALKQIELLNKMSPTSLKITHRQIREGADKDLAECLQMEFRMTQGCMANPDFFEGVRAVLIDKDHLPQWQPASLGEVSDEVVDAYFAPIENELTFEKPVDPIR